MSEPGPDPIADPGGSRPGIAALLNQLAHDTNDFARAEIAFLRAQAGERTSYALPGLAMVLVALTMAFALIVALIVTAMLWLAAVIGPGLAMLAVALSVALLAALLARFGTARLRNAFKAREKR